MQGKNSVQCDGCRVGACNDFVLSSFTIYSSVKKGIEAIIAFFFFFYFFFLYFFSILLWKKPEVVREIKTDNFGL